MDTGDEARYYCPGCQEAPEGRLATTRWCDSHAPSREGADDGRVGDGLPLTGTAEADGQTCRAWAKLLHRPRKG